MASLTSSLAFAMKPLTPLVMLLGRMASRTDLGVVRGVLVEVEEEALAEVDDASVRVPWYGPVVAVEAEWLKGVIWSIARVVALRMSAVDARERAAAEAKVNWIVAGAKPMKTGVRSGRPYMSVLRSWTVLGSCTPVSPPSCEGSVSVMWSVWGKMQPIYPHGEMLEECTGHWQNEVRIRDCEILEPEVASGLQPRDSSIHHIPAHSPQSEPKWDLYKG